jgi:UDP-2-acetamido-3-amino-2,3-dideoxy-glucuronate N-acetyltransferase
VTPILDASSAPQIHPTAFVEAGAELAPGVRIWHNCQIRKGARLGRAVSVGKDSYIDAGVAVGEGTRIQNQVNVYTGVNLGKWCFIGPTVVFTNDQFPRVGNKSWKIIETHVENGASIGAGAIIRCGIRVGAFAMIGAGALVTKSVAPFTLVIGHPAGDSKRICGCGQTVLPLDCSRDELIRDCCRENMSEVTLDLAVAESKKI